MPLQNSDVSSVELPTELFPRPRYTTSAWIEDLGKEVTITTSYPCVPFTTKTAPSGSPSMQDEGPGNDCSAQKKPS